MNYTFELKGILGSIISKNLSLELESYPAILFGLETAFRSFESKNPFVFSKSNFTTGEGSLSINGLIWMAKKSFMKKQIKEKHTKHSP